MRPERVRLLQKLGLGRQPAPQPRQPPQQQNSRPRTLHPYPVKMRRQRRLAALEDAPYRVSVNFSIVGVQKAATSTLHRMLAHHPNIAGGPEKEIRLFIMEDVDWARPDYSDYARPSYEAGCTMAGDATPEYLFWPRGLERMKRYNADMPLLATFRDPIERAFSQWSMERMRESLFPDVPETIEHWATPRIPDDVSDAFTLRQRSLYTRGLYGQQLERGLGLFPREQWLLIDLREIATDLRSVLDRATDHLSLPRFAEYPKRLHENRTPTSNVGAAPSVADIQRLVDLYADDLALFRQLSGLDISHWPTAKVLDGRLAISDFRDRLVAKLGLEG